MRLFVLPPVLRFATRALLALLVWEYSPATSATAAEFRNFSASYSVRAAGLKVGEMQRRLTLGPANHYRFESKIKSTGLAALLRDGSIEEISDGELTTSEIRPRTYVYRRISGRKGKEIETRFEWESARIITQHRATTSELAILPGVLDKLVYQLALMRDLAKGKRSLQYSIVDGERIKSYALVHAGEENVDVNGQTVVAQKMVYSREGSERRTTLWCAADYAYMPIQIEYREDDGGVTLATLTAFE